MTTEADARARLLAHYESRLTLLSGRLALLEAQLAGADASQRRPIDANISRTRKEIAKIEVDAARLREAMARK